MVNPNDNEDDAQPGQLLLSYPSVESYIVSNFVDDTSSLSFHLGKEVKTFIGNNTQIQLNKVSDETIIKAAREFADYLMNEAIDWDVDDFAPASHAVFTRQETNYLQGEGFQLFSMLTLAFLQMGIIEFE